MRKRTILSPALLPTQTEGARPCPPSTRANPALRRTAKAPSNTSCAASHFRPHNMLARENSENGSAETRTTNTCRRNSSPHGTLMLTTSFLERRRSPPNPPPNPNPTSPHAGAILSKRATRLSDRIVHTDEAPHLKQARSVPHKNRFDPPVNNLRVLLVPISSPAVARQPNCSPSSCAKRSEPPLGFSRYKAPERHWSKSCGYLQRCCNAFGTGLVSLPTSELP
jgi:hypothetical protein